MKHGSRSRLGVDGRSQLFVCRLELIIYKVVRWRKMFSHSNLCSTRICFFFFNFFLWMRMEITFIIRNYTLGNPRLCVIVHKSYRRGKLRRKTLYNGLNPKSVGKNQTHDLQLVFYKNYNTN